jgi:hypothetical protein
MYEALGLADLLADMINDAKLHDAGARYRVAVTDTAGNLAEISWNAERGCWAWEEGVSSELLERLRSRT